MVNIGNVMIIGDSYSTFIGCLPEGYLHWYFPGKDTTNVHDVAQTWWKGLLDSTQSHLVRNDSWSGTTIGNTGYDGEDVSARSFIGRFDRLAAEGFFRENQIDTLFIFGGTNDSWSNAPVGELQYEDWAKADLYRVLPAFCYLLNRVKDTLPDTRVICLFNTELKEEITGGFATACEHYGVEYIQLQDVSKMNGHPDLTGMTAIKEQTLTYLER